MRINGVEIRSVEICFVVIVISFLMIITTVSLARDN